MDDIDSRQQAEIDFWKNAKHESPDSDSVYNIINKMSEANVFMEVVERHKKLLTDSGKVLELGGGQGWASCLYKRLFPDVEITTTDLSKYAVMSLPKWERIFEVKVDHSYACPCYQTLEKDSSIDLVFSFSAAHHFLAHRRTLKEIQRILKPNGKAVYFYEPASTRFFYPLAKWKTNREREGVPEDILILSKIKSLTQETGLHLTIDYHPSLVNRGPFETLYFATLKKFPFLQKILPSSVNLIFKKDGFQ